MILVYRCEAYHSRALTRHVVPRGLRLSALNQVSMLNVDACCYDAGRVCKREESAKGPDDLSWYRAKTFTTQQPSTPLLVLHFTLDFQRLGLQSWHTDGHRPCASALNMHTNAEKNLGQPRQMHPKLITFFSCCRRTLVRWYQTRGAGWLSSGRVQSQRSYSI